MSVFESYYRHLRQVLIFCPSKWGPYELKLIDAERRFIACEQLLQRQNHKGFSHRIVTGDEKCVRCDNPKCTMSRGMLRHASTSTDRPNIHGVKIMLCIWWGQLGVVYYELLKPSETITRVRYRTQLMRLRRALKEKRPQYQERHDKVILQPGNSRPYVAIPVKTYLETLKWEVLPYPPYYPAVAPSNYDLFKSMAHSLISISALMKKSKNGSIRGSPQKTHIFLEMASDNCQEDRKKWWLATEST